MWYHYLQVKCQRYWPVTEAELFGSLTVNPIGDWELTDYTIRKFQLQQVIRQFEHCLSSASPLWFSIIFGFVVLFRSV